MKKLALLGLVATFGLLALTPMANAFHGSAYHAHGIATRNNSVYTVDVDWNGWAWQPYASYVVKIHDASGNNVVNTVFAGRENLVGGYPLASRWEIFLYTGTDTATSGNVFKISGFQQILITPQLQQMVYVGNYMDYQLTLLVDGPN